MISGPVYCCTRSTKYTVLYREKMTCQTWWYRHCQSTKIWEKKIKLSNTVKLMSSGKKYKKLKKKNNCVNEIREVTYRIHLQIYNTTGLSMNWLFKHFWSILFWNYSGCTPQLEASLCFRGSALFNFATLKALLVSNLIPGLLTSATTITQSRHGSGYQY